MKNKRFLISIAFSLSFLMIVVMSLTVNDGSQAKSSLVSSEVAVARSLLYAEDDGRFGGFTELPVEIRGQVMTYDEAVKKVYGHSINENEGIYSLKDYPVWFVALRGSFVEHVPGAIDIPPKDVLHSQMVIILDGNSAEAFEVILISPTKELAVNSFPILPVPLDEPSNIPTKMPIVEVTPVPTVSSGLMEAKP